MKIMNAEFYNVETGEVRILPLTEAENIVRSSFGRFSFIKPLPEGWDRQIPRYRATAPLRPSPKERHRHEPPFTSSTDPSCWQYGERSIVAGETIETTAWPHPSFQGLNDSARQIQKFFASAVKSRLQVSPWRNGRVHLADAMAFGTPQAKIVDPDATKLRSADVHPKQGPRRIVGGW
ncbi:hypothetical protein ACVWWO_009534 [Bradyrhizobium sp. F1.13.1]